jgi:hypothetical protein
MLLLWVNKDILQSAKEEEKEVFGVIKVQINTPGPKSVETIFSNNSELHYRQLKYSYSAVWLGLMLQNREYVLWQDNI